MHFSFHYRDERHIENCSVQLVCSIWRRQANLPVYLRGICGLISPCMNISSVIEWLGIGWSPSLSPREVGRNHGEPFTFKLLPYWAWCIMWVDQRLMLSMLLRVSHELQTSPPSDLWCIHPWCLWEAAGHGRESDSSPAGGEKKDWCTCVKVVRGGRDELMWRRTIAPRCKLISSPHTIYHSLRALLTFERAADESWGGSRRAGPHRHFVVGFCILWSSPPEGSAVERHTYQTVCAYVYHLLILQRSSTSNIEIWAFSWIVLGEPTLVL